MKKSLISYSVIIALTASACSPRKENSSVPSPVQPEATKPLTGWDYFQQLLGESNINSNLPLAEALVPLLQEMNPEVVIELRKRIASQEIMVLSAKASEQLAKVHQEFIVGESPVAADPQMLARTLNLNPSIVEQSNAFNHQLEAKVAGLAQSVALQNLLKVFNEQITSDSNEIAAQIVKQLTNSKSDILEKIDKTKALPDRNQKLTKIIGYLKQADSLFVQYGVQPSDQTAMVVYASVASVLVLTLEQHPSVKVLGDKVRDIVDLTMKARRLVSLARTLQEYGETLQTDAVGLGKSVKVIFNKVREIQADLDIQVSSDGKKKAHAILNDFLSGSTEKQIAQDEDYEAGLVGFFEKKRELDNDVQDFLNRADKASQSLNNILNITQKVTDAVGIKLPNEVQKAVHVAVQINQTVKAVQIVSKAFSNGGIVGALGAFSGGPATMALAVFGGEMGANSENAAILSELSAIKKSLAEITRLQQEILENQKKMFVMMKELALLIEEYHREEMMALTDIREEITDVKSGISEIDEAAFRSCQALTASALNKASYYLKPQTAAAQPAVYKFVYSNVDLIKQTLKEVNRTPEALSQFVNKGSALNFKTCQQELSTVFLDGDHLKFSRELWVDQDAFGKKVRDGSLIARKYFAPALSYLGRVTATKEGRWENLGLHLPVLDVQALTTSKVKFLDQAGDGSNLVELRNLTATNKLEKYVSALLVLHPYMSIDAEVWSGPFADLVKVGTTADTLGRSREMLVNAFQRIQMAIAQEAILAGEPLLPFLNQDWDKVIQLDHQCPANSWSYCFVRENSLMMENLMTYVLNQRIGGSVNNKNSQADLKRSTYKNLLAQPGLMAQVLGVSANRIKVQGDGQVILSLSSDGKQSIRFPDVEVVAQGHIQYTQAMSRLLRLQHKVADELVKLNYKGSADNVGSGLALSMFL